MHALLLHLQEQLQLLGLDLAKELDKSGLTMFSVLVLKPGLLTVLLMHLEVTTVVTLKMLEFDAILLQVIYLGVFDAYYD